MELAEFVLWALLCIPFFWFGIKVSHVKWVSPHAPRPHAPSRPAVAER